jgi:hypothetical protein
MTWFTENPWPPIFLLFVVAGMLVAAWTSQKRGIWLLGALTALVAAAAVYFIERSVVTEAERVEMKVHAVAGAFERKDKDATLAFFSVQSPEVREMVADALEWVDLPDGVDIKDMSVRMSNENTRAVARFRANGNVSVRKFAPHHEASRWEVTWQKEAGEWKIIAVDRLDLIKDEKRPIPRP